MNDTIVKVNLPRNLTATDCHLFEPFQSYRLNRLMVKKMQFVFMSYIGYCMDEHGLIKECHHDYPEQYQDYLNDVGYYFHQASQDESNLIYLENENEYLVIHHPWANYYHWMTETIGKLWMVKDDLQNLILIIPEDLRRNPYVKGSLEPFSFKEIFYVPVNKNLFIKNLCLPQLKPICETYDAKMLNEQREFYVKYVRDTLKISVNAGYRVYVSRKLAPKRRIQNEHEVEAVLKKYDFTIVYCEQYSFAEQVSLFSQAAFLVSIHGAGLTNMVFMPKGSCILELHKRMTNSKDHHSLVYWRLASALEHDYYHQICEPVDPEADFFSADFVVDTQELEKNISIALQDHKTSSVHATTL